MRRTVVSRIVRHFVALLGVSALMSVTPRLANAQQDARDDAPVCLGFSFGPWTPKLDWRAAGHGAPVDTSRLEHAPLGRDWATNVKAGKGEPDSLLILFPSFWPAGVSVDIPKRAPEPGDTIVGRARAFVASGDKAVPTSRVRVWRVPCAR